MDDITPDAERPPQPPAATPTLPFIRPADYYARPERVRFVPRWLTLGCGSLSIVFLAALFVTGAMVANGSAGALLDKGFGMLQNDVDGRFAKSVPQSDKSEFDAEMNALRGKLRTGHARLETLQPLIREINKAGSDGSVSPDEAKRLIDAARAANAVPRRER